MAARWGTPCDECGLDRAMCLGHAPPKQPEPVPTDVTRWRRCTVHVVADSRPSMTCGEDAGWNVVRKHNRYLAVYDGTAPYCAQHSKQIARLLNGEGEREQRAAS